jgi:transcriptional regulator with XRE-family HTH domain
MSRVKKQKNIILGRRLLEAREKIGLTQEKLAHKLGYNNYQAIKNIENGWTEMSPQVAKLMQCEFGISKKWLLEGEGEMLTQEAEQEIFIQKIINTSVNEPLPSYSNGLLSIEEKTVVIRSFIDQAMTEGPMARSLFVNKFIKCFGPEFDAWLETKQPQPIQPSESAPTGESHGNKKV